MRLNNIDIFLSVAVENGGRHIHLFQFPIAGTGKCEDSIIILQFYNRGKCLVLIDILGLTNTCTTHRTFDRRFSLKTHSALRVRTEGEVSLTSKSRYLIRIPSHCSQFISTGKHLRKTKGSNSFEYVY